MYEKGKWSLGATADHTDGFVTAINVLGVGYNEEADPITWLTAHVSYKFNDMFSVAWKGRTCWTTSRPTASTATRCCRRVITDMAGRSTWA